ncbi:MAG: hypothetical protein ABSE96_16885 [Terracidiphilus sp.]|jgi:hypothetical protein
MRQDVYSVAYDEANAELQNITNRFEELKRRKQSLESVVAVLGPILRIQGAGSATALSADVLPMGLVASPEPANYTFNQVPVPLPETEDGDPFQRRVRNALKFTSNNGRVHRGLQSVS